MHRAYKPVHETNTTMRVSAEKWYLFAGCGRRSSAVDTPSPLHCPDHRTRHSNSHPPAVCDAIEAQQSTKRLKMIVMRVNARTDTMNVLGVGLHVQERHGTTHRLEEIWTLHKHIAHEKTTVRTATNREMTCRSKAVGVNQILRHLQRTTEQSPIIQYQCQHQYMRTTNSTNSANM